MRRILTVIAVVLIAVAQTNAAEMKINVTVGDKTFAATIDDTATGRAFFDLLPMTLNMSELDGNEKYFYLDTTLPTATYRPGTIKAGDLLLYGSSCVVLFYETFSSGYSYTRIGALDNPDGIAQAVGSGAATVKFEKASSAVTSIADVPSGGSKVTAICGINGNAVAHKAIDKLPQGVYVVKYSNGETRKIIK